MVVLKMLGSIQITNYSDKEVVFVSHHKGDDIVLAEKTRKHAIKPKEYLVLFTDRLESLHWEKDVGVGK